MSDVVCVSSSDDEAEAPVAQWGRLPAEAWSIISFFLCDRSASRGSVASPVLKLAFASHEAWALRAKATWARLQGLTVKQQEALAEAFGSTGPPGYTSRLSLLKQKSVVIFSTRRDRSVALAELARHMGARSVAVTRQRGGEDVEEADISIVEQGCRGRCAPGRSRWGMAGKGCSSPSVFSAQWLSASYVVGCLLPAHRPGCPSGGSPYSMPRSCIAPPRHAARGAQLCCFAPRILEGFLISASRVENRPFLASIVHALGGEFTEELTADHTHLIAGESAGMKVEFARAHRIPVVSREWLLMTHRHGSPMQERCFPVGGGQAEDY